MGGAPSKTRKLTVDNEDPTSVIKVSEDVVDRIRGNQTVRQEAQINSGVAVYPPAGAILAAPCFFNEPSLTSLQLRQANVAELKKNDDYWGNRLRALEGNHKKINETMDHEYKKAVEEIQGNKTNALGNQPPCLDTRKAVMECYKTYPNEPMRCGKLVQAFQECVDLKRSYLLANRG